LNERNEKNNVKMDETDDNIKVIEMKTFGRDIICR